MPTLKQGSSGPDVKDLQQKLKDLGFDPREVEGHFGPGSKTQLSRREQLVYFDLIDVPISIRSIGLLQKMNHA